MPTDLPPKATPPHHHPDHCKQINYEYTKQQQHNISSPAYSVQKVFSLDNLNVKILGVPNP
jgi:hypothetical protein